MKKRLLVSFSGGRTSGYMTKRILDTWENLYDEIVVLFANTGCEHEKTLEFVRNCDENFGFNTVWLEAVIDPEIGKGTRHQIVDFCSASRHGEPYEDAIRKYGLSNPGAPWCTRELKMNPLRSYVRSLGWDSKTFDQVLGIRADEIDRMSVHAEENRIKYPLVSWSVNKTMVLDWWEKQSFDLELQELEGNCVWCFKKSFRKLYTLAKNNPKYFDFPLRMERQYGLVGSMAAKHGQQTFFRGSHSASDIIAKSKEPFVEWSPTMDLKQMGLFSLDEMDYSNGCSESCEVEYI